MGSINKNIEPITILYAEDNRTVATVVKDTLELEGWNVEICAGGLSARQQIESQTHYDLLLIDMQLPEIEGRELIQRARRLPHRRQTPVVVFSAGEYQQEALEAGADVYLRKPEDVYSIVSTIAQLLHIQTNELQNS